MSEVYLADNTKLQYQVAIKFLPSRITVNETDKARFLQIAQAAAAINQPNVCVIYEIQDQEESLFFYKQTRVEGKFTFLAIGMLTGLPSKGRTASTRKT